MRRPWRAGSEAMGVACVSCHVFQICTSLTDGLTQTTSTGVHLLIKSPRFSQSTDKIRAGSSKLVIHMPAARQEALSTLFGLSQRKQGNYITSISMKDLLISSVRRSTNLVRINLVAQIFDVRKYNIGRLAVDLMVLATSDGRNVRSNSSINNDVFLTSVIVDGDTANDFESVAEVYFLGNFAKGVVKLGERECFLGDVSDAQLQCYFNQNVNVVC